MADRQISAGSLHSGYPIMGHEHHAAGWLDVGAIKSKGNWGMFHEIGHNFQWRPWVIPKTTEVSVNLWSVHSCEKIVGPSAKCHANAYAPKSDQLVSEFVSKGANYAAWSTWGSLQMYLQLQQGFGWDAFKKVQKVYLAVPLKDAATTDALRHDRYCERFSAAVGKDLGKFFRAWAMPVSKAGCLDKTKQYPPWLQDPMRKLLSYAGEVEASGAVAATGGKATLSWKVLDPGGKGAKLTLFWGHVDGAKTPSSWAFSKDLGAPKHGPGNVWVGGLTAGKKAWFRARISDAKGGYWSAKSVTFTAK